jgi:hypothetical protein
MLNKIIFYLETQHINIIPNQTMQSMTFYNTYLLNQILHEFLLHHIFFLIWINVYKVVKYGLTKQLDVQCSHVSLS